MTSQGDSSREVELKKELFSLQDKRKAIEDEILVQKVVLENNRIGMNESLVDKDDFPRNDIDVWAVRQARSKINKLENDIKDLMVQMQSKLEELHSLTRQPSSA